MTRSEKIELNRLRETIADGKRLMRDDAAFVWWTRVEKHGDRLFDLAYDLVEDNRSDKER